MATKLSNLKCDKAVLREKPYSLFDGGGLHLQVKPTGGKIWRWSYRFEGKMKSMSFGKYPDVSLAQVRLLHAAARALLASGVDPMAVRKEEKTEKEAAQATLADKASSESPSFTFETLARKWFAWWKQDKAPRYVVQVEARIETDVLAVIGAVSPDQVRRMDVVRLVQAIDQRGARDIARRTLQVIRQIYFFGLNHGLLDEDLNNPAVGIDPELILSKTRVRHHASLKIQEIPELLRCQRNYSGSVYTRIGLELIALTALRTGELIGGRWEEIDWTLRRWTVPAARMKMKTTHIVPLSSQALTLLRQLHDASGASGRLFPEMNGVSGTMNKNTMLFAYKRMGYQGRMTGHGWRSIFSTQLREQGFPKDHVEIQLAHLSGNEVERAYNYAEYLEPRAAMMQHWADFLDECRAGKTGNAQAA